MRIAKPHLFPPRPKTGRAEQWQPGRRPAGIVLERPSSAGNAALLPLPAHALLSTLPGRVTVFAGDWVVTEPPGRRHVVPNQSIAQRYTALENQPDVFVPRATHNGPGRTETFPQGDATC